jgi:hypothetical protein
MNATVMIVRVRAFVAHDRSTFSLAGVGRTGQSVRVTEHDFDLLVEVSGLIDAWCDRRELRALARLLPAWLANNGLTDGWREVLEALSAIRADDRLPYDEAFLIECSIAAVERMVYRS